MGRIVVAALLAAIAGLIILSATRLRQGGYRDRFWILLAGSLPFLVGSGFVLWRGFPSRDPLAATHAPAIRPRGFGPDWTCAPIPHHKVCHRISR